MTRRALPSRARRARGRVLHARRVEGRAPATVVVPRELEIVALTRHAGCNPTNAGPRIEPPAEGAQGAVVRGHRAAGEAEGCPAEPTAPDRSRLVGGSGT